MSIFDKNSDLEDKLEMMKLKNQLLDEKVSSTQKKAMIKEIKKKYGRDWKSILKLGKDSDMLKQFAHAGKSMGDVGGRESTDINVSTVGSGGGASRYGFSRPSVPSQPSRLSGTPRPQSSTPKSLVEGSRKSLGL